MCVVGAEDLEQTPRVLAADDLAHLVRKEGGQWHVRPVGTSAYFAEVTFVDASDDSEVRSVEDRV